MYDYVIGPTPSQESDQSCMIMLGPTPRLGVGPST
jgi:hypothetical protein